MLILAWFACTVPDDSDTDAPADAPPPIGAPIDAPADTWTWVDVEGTSCDDGSPTGIAVNPGATDNVLVLFNGGGACWDYTTCIDLGTAASGPFGASQWSGYARAWRGSVFDRASEDNPFSDWTYVFIPYCTGDLHGGDHVVTYTRGDDSAEYAHVGHTNVLRDLERIAATWTDPDKLVVAGLSAGGGGVLLNYATFRWYYPNTESYLIDDSLPMFVGDAIQPWMRETWIETWHLTPTVEPVCPGCAADFSQFHSALAARYPDDRMALTSSMQDATISGYYLMSGPSYEKNLDLLDTTILGPSPVWNRFFIEGDQHTMITAPGRVATTEGQGLWPWLTALVTDDPLWADVGP